jgi:ankyrin repeat protein
MRRPKISSNPTIDKKKTPVQWRKVLGLSQGQVVTERVIHKAFHKQALRAHPNKPGGSPAAFHHLVAARNAGLSKIRGTRKQKKQRPLLLTNTNTQNVCPISLNAIPPARQIVLDKCKYNADSLAQLLRTTHRVPHSRRLMTQSNKNSILAKASPKYVAPVLFRAVKNRDIETVRRMIASGVNVNVADNNGLTSLHHAAGHNNGGNRLVDIVALLLENGASVDAVDKQKFTPLHYATYYGQYKIVELLLQNGASVNAVSDTGVTPLHGAAYWWSIDIVKLLLDNGANVSIRNQQGKTARNLTTRPVNKNASLQYNERDNTIALLSNPPVVPNPPVPPPTSYAARARRWLGWA